jgi:hypothetical protein
MEDRMSVKEKVSYSVELDPPQLGYIEEMARKYNLPDAGKAIRCLINHARENPALQDAIFGEVHCVDCG